MFARWQHGRGLRALIASRYSLRTSYQSAVYYDTIQRYVMLHPNSTSSVCCGFVGQQVVQQACTTSWHFEMLWISCRSSIVIQQLVALFPWTFDLLYNKYTIYQTGGVLGWSFFQLQPKAVLQVKHNKNVARVSQIVYSTHHFAEGGRTFAFPHGARGPIYKSYLREFTQDSAKFIRQQLQILQLFLSYSRTFFCRVLRKIFF